jgi:hypothetical protein
MKLPNNTPEPPRMVDLNQHEGHRLLLDDLLDQRRRVRKNVPHYDISTSEKLSVLLAAEKMIVSSVKQEVCVDGAPFFLICAMEYDLFAYGYTAYREVTNDEIKEAFEFHVLDPEDGVQVWLCHKAQQMPVPRRLAQFTARGWVFETETVEGKEHDKLICRMEKKDVAETPADEAAADPQA